MTEQAFTLLRLEQQFESYQKMHQEELDEIRRAIVELRNQLLFTPLVPANGQNGNRIHPRSQKETLFVNNETNQDEKITRKPR